MFKHYEVIRNELLETEGIEAVTVTGANPIRVGNSTNSVHWQGKAPESNVSFCNFFADFDFVKTFKIEIVEGRDFDRNVLGDSSNFLVNEAAAAIMGFEPGNRAGQEITFWRSWKGRIVGVMKDFNIHSVHSKIEPLILPMNKEWYSMLHTRIQMQHIDQVLAVLKDVQKRYAPDYPFEYHFLDESWGKMYSSEQKMGKLFNFFALIAIIISCLGLCGLAAFSIERRTKELGIRKVMGASVFSIINLVSKEYFILVTLAFIIGSPVAWYAMKQWLADFAFHIKLNPQTFIIAVVISLVLAIGTVSYFALKAARTNPVNALRYE